QRIGALRRTKGDVAADARRQVDDVGLKAAGGQVLQHRVGQVRVRRRALDVDDWTRPGHLDRLADRRDGERQVDRDRRAERQDDVRLFDGLESGERRFHLVDAWTQRREAIDPL